MDRRRDGDRADRLREQTDFASRPDDAAPTAFGVVGELLHEAWGQP